MSSKYDHNEIAKLYSSGLSGRSVSKKIGCSPALVWQIARAKGIIRDMKSAAYERPGSKNPNWRGGVNYHSNGYAKYKMIHRPDHPLADVRGYVGEHILVYEEHNNVSVKKGQVVHHIDLNPNNNDPSNLQLLENQSEHAKLHAKLRRESKL